MKKSKSRNDVALGGVTYCSTMSSSDFSMVELTARGMATAMGILSTEYAPPLHSSWIRNWAVGMNSRQYKSRGPAYALP